MLFDSRPVAGLKNDEEIFTESNLSSVMETPEFLKKALGGKMLMTAVTFMHGDFIVMPYILTS